MSADQLAAVLKATPHAYVSDSDETAGDSNDKLQVPNTIHSAIGTAMSHTPTDGMHAAHEEAISHTTSSETITPRKTKKRSAHADTERSSKKVKVDGVFKPVAAPESMLHCVCHGHECIPLWPQYEHNTTSEKFIKVDVKTQV